MNEATKPQRMDDEERGLALAQRLELAVSGEPAAAVVFGGCWLLASVVVQLLEEKGQTVDPIRAVELVSMQFGRCVKELMETRGATKQ